MRLGRPTPPLTLTDDERETLGLGSQAQDGASIGPAGPNGSGTAAKGDEHRCGRRVESVESDGWEVAVSVLSTGRTSGRAEAWQTPTVTDADVERVVTLTLGDHTEGLHKYAVHGPQVGLSPSVSRTASPDGDLQVVDTRCSSKRRDIVGLYLYPPDRALVCVDEKTQIQALDRTRPLLPMRPGLERAHMITFGMGTTSRLPLLTPRAARCWPVPQFHRARSKVPRYYRSTCI